MSSARCCGLGRWREVCSSSLTRRSRDLSRPKYQIVVAMTTTGPVGGSAPAPASTVARPSISTRSVLSSRSSAMCVHLLPFLALLASRPLTSPTPSKETSEPSDSLTPDAAYDEPSSVRAEPLLVRGRPSHPPSPLAVAPRSKRPPAAVPPPSIPWP